jgi:hypothetical protein
MVTESVLVGALAAITAAVVAYFVYPATSRMIFPDIAASELRSLNLCHLNVLSSSPKSVSQRCAAAAFPKVVETLASSRLARRSRPTTRRSSRGGGPCLG